MSDRNNGQQQSKRRTLKAILGGTGAVAGASALPDKWSKPITSSVILPAHAQGTPAGDCFIEGYSAQQTETGREVDVSIEWGAEIVATQEWQISFSAPGLLEVTGETSGDITPSEGFSQEFLIEFAESIPTEIEATITVGSGITCEAETAVVPFDE